MTDEELIKWGVEAYKMQQATTERPPEMVNHLSSDTAMEFIRRSDSEDFRARYVEALKAEGIIYGQ